MILFVYMAERKLFAQFTGYDCFQPVMYSIVFFYGLFATFTDYVVCRFICFSSDVASTVFLSLIYIRASKNPPRRTKAVESYYKYYPLIPTVLELLAKP